MIINYDLFKLANLAFKYTDKFINQFQDLSRASTSPQF